MYIIVTDFLVNFIYFIFSLVYSVYSCHTTNHGNIVYKHLLFAKNMSIKFSSFVTIMQYRHVYIFVFVLMEYCLRTNSR